ncbi:ExbD/TolR family protein [Phaeobacter sp. QD34_3]|uniref:ExbD/TolR family protein n=1 Tax=unclassified Phaeobacter TaxID=2621772 RepID=UPI00406BF3FD
MRIMRHIQSEREPTIALINIVFLMLVFFMIAGTLAPPMDREVKLINTADLEGSAPPDTLVIHADGALAYRGEAVLDAEAYVAGLSEEQRAALRVVPDRALPAKELVKIGNALRAAGAERVILVSERALK